jgi:hypothetical protein
MPRSFRVKHTRTAWNLALEIEREYGEQAPYRLAEIVLHAVRERDKDAIQLWHQVVQVYPALRTEHISVPLN